jgi:predicted O-linked N-acetylglucosamine transferase (SPINDLY family)
VIGLIALNLVRNRGRTMLTAAGVAIGVATNRRDYVQQGALAAARRADEGHHFTRRHRQRDLP